MTQGLFKERAYTRPITQAVPVEVTPRTSTRKSRLESDFETFRQRGEQHQARGGRGQDLATPVRRVVTAARADTGFRFHIPENVAEEIRRSTALPRAGYSMSAMAANYASQDYEPGSDDGHDNDVDEVEATDVAPVTVPVISRGWVRGGDTSDSGENPCAEIRLTSSEAEEAPRVIASVPPSVVEAEQSISRMGRTLPQSYVVNYDFADIEHRHAQLTRGSTRTGRVSSERPNISEIPRPYQPPRNEDGDRVPVPADPEPCEEIAADVSDPFRTWGSTTVARTTPMSTQEAEEAAARAVSRLTRERAEATSTALDWAALRNALRRVRHE